MIKPSAKKLVAKANRRMMRTPPRFRPGAVYTKSDGRKYVCFPDGSLRSLDKMKAAKDAEEAGGQA